MTPARMQQIQDLYMEALERPPGERDLFLSQACAGDEELRKQVESLLAQNASAPDALQRPAVSLLAKVLDSEVSPGSSLGPYKIESLLGAGGMGQVYKARDTRLDRDVALKILPAEVAGDASRRQRFETEARAVAALKHPNIVPVFDVGTEHGIPYIVSELVDGEPLRGVKFGLSKTVDIALQIAAGLAAAHDAGVVHRDLKPDNILLTRDGRVKILDFGLAKLGARQTDEATSAETLTIRTQPGVVMGTVGYMSPEQVLGLSVNNRTDMFSLGVVLYELVTGERPFKGDSAMAVCDAILHAQPRDFGDRPVPEKLKAIIRRLLEKNPEDRYGSADEVYRELKALETSLGPARAVRLSRNAWIAVGAGIVLICVLGGWLWHRSSRERWALGTATPEIARLVDMGEYVKAATLAREARTVLPKDPTLERLWKRSTGEVSIDSAPSGADVAFRPYRGDPNAWQTLGQTPLKKVRMPRDAYVWRVAKPGFAALFFIGEPPGPMVPGTQGGFEVTLKLRSEASVPGDMVLVLGDWVGLGYPLLEAPSVHVDDFLIDRHEVTNEDYKKFVEAGGYQKRGFWKEPFARDGRAIPWEDAVTLFRDATGRPGPATWEVGDYPKGHEKYPVAGVSWFEAAAYAEFAGKSLPTAYHWTGASQSGYTAVITPGSNFGREGTRPVGSQGALSGFGTTDMAGNVKEWVLNEARDGKRLILGGGFGEPNYLFYQTDTQSPWERRANFGFRCVKLDSPPSAAAAAHLEVKTSDYSKEKPVSDEVFKAYTALYVYDKGQLNARVEETVTTGAWSRWKVSFDAAYGQERVTAYLFLPKKASPPFQTIIHFPGAGAFFDDKLDLDSVEDSYDFFLKSGRALIVPIYKGTYERRDGFEGVRSPPAMQRDHTIAWSKDLGRLLDYLETRKDIDSGKIAYFGMSAGASRGVVLLAVERRIKAAILWAGGFYREQHFLPEADSFNFASHLTIPVLMLNGRYDGTFPLESSQLPLFRLLGTPANDKRHKIYESGHGPPVGPDAVRECLDWLDKYLGPVRR